MAFWDKLMFWKKGGDDDFMNPRLGLGATSRTGLDLGAMNPGANPLGPGLGQSGTDQFPPLGFETQQNPGAFQQMRDTNQQDLTSQKLDLISSKLDFIKSNLDNINQRLANIEKIAEGERKGRW